jgi:hypothetical protein
MKFDQHEALCIKFAAELIDMVMRVKGNRASPKKTLVQEQGPEDVQYFIHTSGIQDFFKKCQDPFAIYIPISVGQFYHEGAHAAAQVACLQNLRDTYECWLQDHLSQPAGLVSVEKVKRTWPVVLVVADSPQALNRIPAVEIDIDVSEGQCIHLLTSQLREVEAPFVEKGTELEGQYRKLFSNNEKVRQKNVAIKFELHHNAIRWSHLMRHYNDPLIIEMINRLESRFKLGIKAILERKDDSKKFPSEVEKLYKKGAFKKWSDSVKLNDLSYVLGEIVMVHCKILPNADRLGELQNAVMMYPGPCNMILGSGKNILSAMYAELVPNVTCSYLRSEMMNPRDANQDKNASLFAGRLSVQGVRILPDDDLLARRKRFIQAEISEAEGLKITIAAMRSAIIRKEKKEKLIEGKKRARFEGGPYAQFLEQFHVECLQCTPLIKQLCTSREMLWNEADPLNAMIQFVSAFLMPNENIDSPRLQRRSSLGSSNDDDCSSVALALKQKLELLLEKFQATSATVKRKDYLRRAACKLVESAVAIRAGGCSPPLQLKRTKSLRHDTSRNAFFSVLSESPPKASVVPVAIIRPNLQERFLAGMFFYIQQITMVLDNDFSLLKAPEYYPDDTPQIEDRPTQDSLSGSVPGSLSQSH